MLKTGVAMFICAALLFSAPAFAIDGQILINQSTVMAAGGFPYKITQPGSYKLSGNLVVSAANTDGIDILSNNVTVDLNGFTISGPVTCTEVGADISCGAVIRSFGVAAATNNVAVRNGSVLGFQYGILLSGGTNYLAEEILATSNADVGLAVEYGVVRRNAASANGVEGIFVYASTATENNASLNGGYGLAAANSVYGSNTFELNGKGPVVNTLAVSQNNNDCNGTAC